MRIRKPAYLGKKYEKGTIFSTMPYCVVFLQEADKDIAEAVAWYQSIEEGLEQRFKSDLSKIIPLLQQNPYIFQEIQPGIRIGLTRHFHFRVVYEIKERTVLIAAVMHPKRHEQRWKGRIRNIPG
jgi:toxin ParE1/3/4